MKLIKDFAPEDVFLECWRPGLAKPSSWSKEYDRDFIDSLLLFVDVLTAENCSNQFDVLKALTVTGNLEALRKLAERPGWFTKRRIKRLIDIASESNMTEITAWLLELSHAEKSGELG